MSRDGKLAGIPIVGGKKFVICPNGHVDELPGAFMMLFPADPRVPPTREDAVSVCRMCVMGFLAMSFPSRVSTATTRAEALAEVARWEMEVRAAGEAAGLEGQLVHGES